MVSRLNGNAPDRATVLLLVDVVNDLEFDGGEALLANALPMAREVAALKAAAKRGGIPAVYVNDNFGRWRSDFRSQVRHCLDDGVRGAALSRLLRPDDDDYFVLKPRHSAFYETPLQLLLADLDARTLIVTGLAGNLCVLATAHDAHIRGYRLVIPGDCTASISREDNARALRHCGRWLGADVRPWRSLDLAALARDASDGGARPAQRAVAG